MNTEGSTGMPVPQGAATDAWDGFDFEGFWDDSAYSRENYTEPAPSDALIAEVEAALGYRLPASFVALARRRNGGALQRSCFPMDEPTGWADDHIAVTGLYAIGRTARWSLCGELGSPFMQAEWGYPAWGVCIADTPTGGHEQIMLDYRECGPTGEPQVVYVSQEDDHAVTFVARNFEAFIRGLVDQEVFDTSEADREEALVTVERGTLSPIVVRALAAAQPLLPEGERALRTLARQIVEDKGHFSLHADERSHRMYDAMFWLYSLLATARSFQDYFDLAEGQGDYARPCHVLMLRASLVAEPYGFCTDGYSECFVHDWWKARVAAGAIVQAGGGWRFTQAAQAAQVVVLARLAEVSHGARE